VTVVASLRKSRRDVVSLLNVDFLDDTVALIIQSIIFVAVICAEAISLAEDESTANAS
jgi:hypothetical protein